MSYAAEPRGHSQRSFAPLRGLRIAARFFATLRALKRAPARPGPGKPDVIERRTKILRVRLSVPEWTQLARRARECGRPISTYARQAMLGIRPRRKAGEVEREAIYQLSRIGNNLNQLTRAANAQRRVELSRRLDQVLRDLRRALQRFHGSEVR